MTIVKQELQNGNNNIHIFPSPVKSFFLSKEKNS